MVYNIVSFLVIGGAKVLFIVLTVAILSSPVLGESEEAPGKELEVPRKENM